MVGRPWQDEPVEIVETLLPGVGIRYELSTREGRSIGLVVHREGEVDLFSYAEDDPDEATDTVHLQAEEATALAELMGAPRVTQRFADLSREVPGLVSARLTVEPGSRYDGAVLGDTQARTRTGCSVVAIVRRDDVVTAPGPDASLRGGDVLVAIGGETGLHELGALLDEPA